MSILQTILYLMIFTILLFFFFFMTYIRNERIELQKEAVVGDMKHSARINDYPGWLICDGRSILREKYHHLFNVIGTKYGSSSATTFNLPDCRGRVLGAIGQGSLLSNRTFGQLEGEEKHVMRIEELVTHTHTGVTSSNGQHTHIATASSNGDHTHTGTTNSTGAHSHSHNANGGNKGLAIADGYNTVIDTDNSAIELNVWASPQSLTINNSGEHTHTVTNTTNGIHTHSVTNSSNGAHTHSFTTDVAGSSQAFNVMQPTIFIGNVFIYYGHRHEVE